MKEVSTKFKEKTIAVDFDGVIHKYSKGFQGLDNAYDPPMPGVFSGLDELKSMGFRLIIVSSRPVEPIKQWLKKHNMEHYFDDVTNIKHPARYYIDDHAVRFEKDDPNSWENIVKFIKYKEEK
jgi:FMN phosphatase YigB (HAD superfamily)